MSDGVHTTLMNFDATQNSKFEYLKGHVNG